jgi:hypothetical protein
VGQSDAGPGAHGLILVDPAKFRRGAPGTIGRIVAALELLLREHPADEGTSLRHWL